MAYPFHHKDFSTHTGQFRKQKLNPNSPASNQRRFYR